MPEEEITKSNQAKWSIIFTFFYVAIFFSCLEILRYVHGGALPLSIPLFDLVLVVLASFRLTRLFVYDHIMQFFRDWFLDKEEYVDERGAVNFKRFPPVTGPRRTLNDLLSCPWCFGMWSGILVPFFYFLTPYAWFIILAMAISALGTMAMLLANLIGWNAELAKKKCNLD